jgi:hypothetical protein
MRLILPVLGFLYRVDGRASFPTETPLEHVASAGEPFWLDGDGVNQGPTPPTLPPRASLRSHRPSIHGLPSSRLFDDDGIVLQRAPVSLNETDMHTPHIFSCDFGESDDEETETGQ